jgi:hypothetical protein
VRVRFAGRGRCLGRRVWYAKADFIHANLYDQRLRPGLEFASAARSGRDEDSIGDAEAEGVDQQQGEHHACHDR